MKSVLWSPLRFPPPPPWNFRLGLPTKSIDRSIKREKNPFIHVNTASYSLNLALKNMEAIPYTTEMLPSVKEPVRFKLNHREPTQSVCVADCYFIVNVLDLPFASPIAIYR